MMLRISSAFEPFLLAFVAVIVQVVFCNDICKEKVGTLNAPLISRYSWQVEVPTSEGGRDTFHFGFCRPLSFPAGSSAVGCNGAMACRVRNGRATVYASAERNASAVTSSGQWIFLTGQNCGTHGQYKISIRASCGIHLGSPEFYTESRTTCQAHFLWRTSAACGASPKRSEVPCYTYDSHGSKVDLSPLILRRGSHTVESLDEGLDFRINVCSDMAPGAQESVNYSVGSGACLLEGNGECVSVGELDSGLRWESGSPTLAYQTNFTLPSRPSCTVAPRTVVVFKCPGRGKSHPPRLISSWNCQYRIEWETQYACPLNLLTGDVSTCKFNSTHGQDLDLSPLISLMGHHNGTVQVDGVNATVLYNVCGKGLDAEENCGQSKGYNTAICLIFNATHSLSLGDVRDPLFRLVDGVASMTFHDGAFCANNRTWSSRIDFVCKEELQGLGHLELDWVDEEYCRYYFSWGTQHACTERSAPVCTVQEGKVRIDIRSLAVGSGQKAWAALGNGEMDRNGTFYLSLCGDSSRPIQKCDSQTAVCFVDFAGKVVSYGRVPSPLAYNAKTRVVSVTVSGGDRCESNGTYSSVVYLICKPGAVSASPVFLGTEECRAEFEWHTASACPLRAVVGTGCRIEDEQLGFTLDLSPLTSSIPYRMESAEYRYYLNVCGGLANAPCKGTRPSPAVCQESKTNSRSWVLGAGEPLLNYVDGMVNLTYVNGTPYNDPARTPRSTSIAFLCDHEAGMGTPQFAEERNRTYTFLWYTSYACPSSYYTSCVHKDPATGLYYDLSRLNQLHDYRDWVVEDLEREGKLRFHLSVCTPLRQLPKGCSSGAAACVLREFSNGTEVVEVADAGKARNPPTFMDGSLTLLYDLGQECTQYGRKMNYSISIHFLCDPKQPESLMLMKKVGNCHYVFVWVTHAACPISHLHSRGSCTLTDPRTGVVYDLSSLALTDSYYSITNGSELYEVNICSPVHGGHCASMGNVSICKVENGTGVPLGLSSNMFLSSKADGSLQLAYVGSSKGHSGDTTKVLIEVSCSHEVEGSELSLVQSSTFSSSLVLSLETDVVCPPENPVGATGCSFTDGQESYDLTPLSKHVWRAQAPLGSRGFLLSFCAPLGTVGFQGTRCPANASACELDLYHTEVPGTSLGSFTVPPQVALDGSITVRYRSGGLCRNGTARRSAVITLFCDETEEHPVFVGESPPCNLLFSMKTPAACPLKVSTGEGCRVMDPRYGYIFDFSSLSNDTKDYTVRMPEYTFLINVCRPLVYAEGTCEGAASCQMKSTDEAFHVGAGQPSDVVTYHNGRISLHYVEGQGPCRGRYNRSTVLQFVCDHSTEGRQESPTFLGEDSECTYLFEWRTRLACPPVIETDCSVSLNDSHLVDLSPLSDPWKNYELRTPSGTKVVLNVCRSVVHQPGSACEHNAGACAVTRPHVTENLGTIREPPYIENGVVKLRYSLGEPCRTEGGQTASMETVVQFECDRAAQAGRPEFVAHNKCEYRLRWRTVYACPLTQDSVHDQCAAVHPLTGMTLNLSPLKRSTPYTVPYGGGSPMAYSLSVCDPVESTICGSGAGACLSGGKVGFRYNLGLANGRVHFRDGVTFLNYSGGDACPLGGRRSSVIQFACPPAGYAHLGPQLAHVQNDCTYYFVWHTELVCRKVVHCVVKEGEQQYDLSPLILASGRYTALNVDRPGFVYYINVCRPLNPVQPYHMFPNAGIVRVSEDGAAVESLGEVPMEPFSDFEGHVSLLYVNGSSCTGNGTVRNKARIIFICDLSTSVEQPVLVDVDVVNCLYIFEWRTNLVCPGRPKLTDETRDSCSFAIPEHGLRFDLAPLRGGMNGSSSSVFEVPVPGGKGKFLVDVCGRLSMAGCESSSVCFLSTNRREEYGVLASATYHHDSLRVRYVNGSMCTSSEALFRSAEIKFECSPNAGIGAPVVEDWYACHSTFRWSTSLVCLSEHQECSATSGNDLYDFGLLSSISSLWNVTDGRGNRYWLNVCHGMKADHSGQQGCPVNAAVCMQTPAGHHFTIGKLISQRITITKLGEVHFTYGGGDPTSCLGKDHYPKTRISFHCPPSGGAIGAPEFVRGPTEKECLFIFRWETRMACPQQEGIILPENNGMIVDTKSNFAMNFSEILNGTFEATETRGSDEYVYVVSLGRPLQTSDKCSGAGVCQTKPSTGFHRDVGSYTTRKFVLRGSELLLEMKSTSSVCGRTSEEVTSVISFFCSSEAGLGRPEFLFESRKCHYVFSWPTSYMCPSSLTALGNKDTQEVPVDGRVADAQSTGASVVTTTIIAVCCLLIVFVVVAMLMKKERRDAVKSKIQRAFRRVSLPQYRYTKTTSRLQAVRDGDTVLLTSAASVSSIEDSGDVDPLG